MSRLCSEKFGLVISLLLRQYGAAGCCLSNLLTFRGRQFHRLAPALSFPILQMDHKQLCFPPIAVTNASRIHIFVVHLRARYIQFISRQGKEVSYALELDPHKPRTAIGSTRTLKSSSHFQLKQNKGKQKKCTLIKLALKMNTTDAKDHDLAPE